ncbi:hypothetical protein PHYPSEUDO_009344 [Phytophthora pseudosyringae]|uniref:Uncharacterized protein n=1 Tax=Phytophthora pseudosyringae TaxID=221518 RepID=A0A8T1W987_9STRA|nr:hypothetical protein PHYPSEUDO_009344 [Phytophthora pseudosyringae]
MEEVVGDAVFASFPGERFRYVVGRVDGVGHIRLESETSKQRWTCEVTDVGAFAPKGVMLPPNTVLHYVAASLKESTGDGSDPGLHLVREDGDKVLLLEVLVKLGAVAFAWAPKYAFPLQLVSEQAPSPVEQAPSPVEQVKLLTAQVQELQQEVKTLKEQMKAVLRAQQEGPTGSLPSPGFTIRPRHLSTPPPATSAAILTKSSHREHAWGAILGHTKHTLAKTEEYRERRNASGAIERRHRPHACKVCSVLRGEGRRASQTCHYCVECTDQRGGGVVFLCDKVRPHRAAEYQKATCNQIWHALWSNGENMPESGVSSIRMRTKLKPSEPGSTPLGHVGKSLV